MPNPRLSPLPRRDKPRAAATSHQYAALATRLTPRDRWIARMLYEHRVLTTQHIREMAFPSDRSTNYRLTDLYEWRVLDRFQPYRPRGRAPWHYVLDVMGAHILAYEDGLDPKTIGYRHGTAMGISHSLQLAHTVGRNGFAAALIAHARAHRDCALTAWWSEDRCHNAFGDIVRPDAYIRWRGPSGELEFFLEYDTSTENLAQLATKLPDYHRLAVTSRISTPLLISFTRTGRESTARRALANALRDLDQPDALPIATGADHDGTGPAGPIWLPIDGDSPDRLSLTDLAARWPLPPSAPTPPSNCKTSANDAARLFPPPSMPPESE